MKNYVIKWGEFFEPNPAPLAGHRWEHPKNPVRTYGSVQFQRPSLGEAKDFAMTIIRKDRQMHKFLVNSEQDSVRFDIWTEPDIMKSLNPNLQFVNRKTSMHRFGELQGGTHFPSYAVLQLVWYECYREKHEWGGREAYYLDRYAKLKLDASRFYPTPLEDEDEDTQKEPVIFH